ncbi:MAG TPA: sulfatase-like hydrolase/transferase [Prosthecobacter sp.]|nr:sulfatase-like hydrolase/transferase [Prosthecobacter sp.]HRK13225.1 sulfatase-like hydrolase/transferase [Prosthecobacter sp.]
MKSFRLLFTLMVMASGLPLLAQPAKPNLIVFYTDDHGWSDLGILGIQKDLKTPHLDALARSGVVARSGYSTAPQCVPSRAGLLAGRFQARFGVESNQSPLDGFNEQTTFAKRLQDAGYATAQFGKWHLGPAHEITRHGFTHVFSQNSQRPFAANITPDGQDRPMSDLPPAAYHIDACSQAAAAVIDRHKDQPFFLYIAYRAPHTPLDAPQRYKDRFPGEMPERRRAALGMIAAMDDGVGLITGTLKKHGLTEKTLIFFIGDNGAPLKIHKVDSPLDGDAGGWDGSLNDPLNGEKGMLSEGGMRVPFVIAWPGTIPGGQVYEHPVSALDVAATAVASIGNRSSEDSITNRIYGDLDGVNLLPYLTGENKAPPHNALYWRWMAQSAIREGNWKLLRGGDREYLYDLANDREEKHNLAAKHPEIATRLRAKLKTWADGLNPPGMALGPMAATWNDYFDHYLEGKTITPQAEKPAPAASATDGWEARNGKLTAKDGLFILTPENSAKPTFITKAKLKLAGPVTAQITLKTTATGQAALAWRLDGDKDFLPANRLPFPLQSTPDWQTHTLNLPTTARIIHLRVHFPGAAEIREIELKAGKR